MNRFVRLQVRRLDLLRKLAVKFPELAMLGSFTNWTKYWTVSSGSCERKQASRRQVGSLAEIGNISQERIASVKVLALPIAILELNFVHANICQGRAKSIELWLVSPEFVMVDPAFLLSRLTVLSR